MSSRSVPGGRASSRAEVLEVKGSRGRDPSRALAIVLALETFPNEGLPQRISPFEDEDDDDYEHD
jgi:hypothetical protein